MARKKTPPEYGLSPCKIRQHGTQWPTRPPRIGCVDLPAKESNVLVPLWSLASETVRRLLLARGSCNVWNARADVTCKSLFALRHHY